LFCYQHIFTALPRSTFSMYPAPGIGLELLAIEGNIFSQFLI